ncbi:zinc finger and BTB [Balamuthia mandrillaris]
MQPLFDNEEVGPIAQLAVSEYLFLAIARSGKVWELRPPGETPTHILEGQHIVQVHVSQNSSTCAAIASTGELYMWGSSLLATEEGSVLKNPTLVKALEGKKVVSVCLGLSHVACITAAGELYTWGSNVWQQLGYDTGGSRVELPRKVTALEGRFVVEASCGFSHTAVITSSGLLYTFGAGSHGALGHGDYVNQGVPRLVDTLANKFVSKVSCGWYHTVVLAKDIDPAEETLKSDLKDNLLTTVLSTARSSSPLLDGIERNFADILIRGSHGNLKFYCHKFILSVMIPSFDDHHQSKNTENGHEASTLEEWEVEGADDVVVKDLIRFVYGDFIDPMPSEHVADDSTKYKEDLFGRLLPLLKLSRRYRLPRLEDLALSAFDDALTPANTLLVWQLLHDYWKSNEQQLEQQHNEDDGHPTPILTEQYYLGQLFRITSTFIVKEFESVVESKLWSASVEENFVSFHEDLKSKVLALKAKYRQQGLGASSSSVTSSATISPSSLFSPPSSASADMELKKDIKARYDGALRKLQQRRADAKKPELFGEAEERENTETKEKDEAKEENTDDETEAEEEMKQEQAVEKEASQYLRNVVQPDYITSMKNLLADPRFTDVTLVVEDENKRIPAHKALLCARSSHFKAMFTSGMKESAISEIIISEVRSSVFTELVHFLYTGKADINEDNVVELLMAANLYTMLSLQECCECFIEKGISKANAAYLYEMAYTYQTPHLQSMALRYMIDLKEREMGQLSLKEGDSNANRVEMLSFNQSFYNRNSREQKLPQSQEQSGQTQGESKEEKEEEEEEIGLEGIQDLSDDAQQAFKKSMNLAHPDHCKFTGAGFKNALCMLAASFNIEAYDEFGNKSLRPNQRYKVLIQRDPADFDSNSFAQFSSSASTTTTTTPSSSTTTSTSSSPSSSLSPGQPAPSFSFPTSSSSNENSFTFGIPSSKPPKSSTRTRNRIRSSKTKKQVEVDRPSAHYSLLEDEVLSFAPEEYLRQQSAAHAVNVNQLHTETEKQKQQGPNGQMTALITRASLFVNDGIYKVSYLPCVAGRWLITIYVNGEQAKGSPFPLQVMDRFQSWAESAASELLSSSSTFVPTYSVTPPPSSFSSNSSTSPTPSSAESPSSPSSSSPSSLPSPSKPSIVSDLLAGLHLGSSTSVASSSTPSPTKSPNRQRQKKSSTKRKVMSATTTLGLATPLPASWSAPSPSPSPPSTTPTSSAVPLFSLVPSTPPPSSPSTASSPFSPSSPSPQQSSSPSGFPFVFGREQNK